MLFEKIHSVDQYGGDMDALLDVSVLVAVCVCTQIGRTKEYVRKLKLNLTEGVIHFGIK